MAQLDAYFHKLCELDGSDLHLTTGCPPMIRINGQIVPQGDTPISADAMKTCLMEIAPKARWETFLQSGDMDFAYEISGLARFRANYFVDSRGLGAVFRLIPSTILTMDQLGLPNVIKKFCFLTKGLIIVTGPTGSGKSTTLAAIINQINAVRNEHIITIEDPIEFVYPRKACLVNQREVNRHTRNFKGALRAALRQDPDVILVGEMRDTETVETAMETAETGHLVFGTLHTTTAATTVDRIIDMFPGERQSQVRSMLSSTLLGVIAQVLCQKTSGGRVAAYEILLSNSALSSLIREGKTFQIPSVMQSNGAQGMRTLNEALIRLVKKKEIEPMEAYLKAIEKDDIVQKLKSAGHIINDHVLDAYFKQHTPGE